MASRLERLRPDILKPLVGRALGRHIGEVTAWESQVLKGSWDGKGNLVSRIAGKALADGREQSWSLIVKIPRPVRPHVDRWQREPLLYRSGVLEELRGPVAAPRCLGVEEPPGDEPWVWMTDVAGIPSNRWPMGRFYLALRHLGDSQGAYLCGKKLPRQEWFDTSWWLRRDAFEGDNRARLAVAATRAHPVAGSVFGGDRGKALLALIDRRERMIEALERLPLTFTHGDLNTTNMIAPEGSGDLTVAVDWHFSGSRVIGYDATTVIACASVFHGPVLGHVREVAEPAIEAYLDGVRQSGWKGDSRLVRFGCLGNLAVRITAGVADLVFRAIDEGHPLQIRDRNRLEKMMAHYADSMDYLLELAGEADALAAGVL